MRSKEQFILEREIEANQSLEDSIKQDFKKLQYILSKLKPLKTKKDGKHE